jgi:hypothetical protein
MLRNVHPAGKPDALSVVFTLNDSWVGKIPWLRLHHFGFAHPERQGESYSWRRQHGRFNEKIRNRTGKYAGIGAGGNFTLISAPLQCDPPGEAH